MTAAPHLAAAYDSVRSTTEALAAPLSPEDQCIQSMPDTSPTKWHRAHTTWFFETFVLLPHAATYRCADPRYGYLFNSYYEQAGPRHPRPQRGLISRPSAAEIGEYRRHVDDAMCRRLTAGVDPEEAALVELGLHHEQQHQELLLMDIKHVLSCNPLQPAYRDDLQHVVRTESAALGWIGHPGGVVTIGNGGEAFCFDNEQPRHDVALVPFELADRPVTCGEWQQFIDDGGYRTATLWLSDGWATVQANEWQAPEYWQADGDGWTVFTLGGRRRVEAHEPVCHISYYEADAFARWAGARLPTEAEWEAAAVSVGASPHPPNDASQDALHPLPASPGSGLRQLFGDVWEWTASPYVAYPGFAAAPGAVGEYNGKFMVNQHVLRGGCCLSPHGHVRATYRNFFPPPARWQCSGVRLARDA